MALTKLFPYVLQQPPPIQVWQLSQQITTTVQTASTTSKQNLLPVNSLVKVQTGTDAAGFPIYSYITTSPPVMIPSTVISANTTTVTTVKPGYWATVIPSAYFAKQPDTGWTGSATSVGAFNGNGEVSFTIAADSVAVVAGLNDIGGEIGSSYTNINYAILASNGLFRVIENGVPKTPYVAFTSTTNFLIRKLGGFVYYLIDGVQFYKSTTLSTDWAMALDASLYASSDSILTASITDLPEGIFAAGNVASASTLALASYRVGNAVHGTNQQISGSGSLLNTGYAIRYGGSISLSGTGSLSLATYKNGSAVHVLAQSLSANGTLLDAGYVNGGYAHGLGAIPRFSSFGSSIAAHAVGRGVLPKLTSLGIADGLQIDSALGVGYLPGLHSVGYSVSGGAVKSPAIQRLHPLKSFASSKVIDSKGKASLRPLVGYGLQWTVLTNYIDAPFSFGEVSAYAEQLPTSVIDIAFSFGTVDSSFGADIAIPFSLGTLTASVTNSNTLIADMPFNFGIVDVTVVTGTLADIAIPFNFGELNALGGAAIDVIFSFGNTDSAAVIGGVSDIAAVFSFGTLAATGYTPNTINIAVPFSFGDFVHTDITIAFSFGVVQARSGFAEDTSIAYCVNTSTGALTRYVNFGFKRIIRFNGNYYGLKADGLYLLEGATDNGTTIDARARTGMFHANDYHVKRIQYAYLRENHYPTSIAVTADDNDFYATYTYLSAFSGKRVKFAMGVSGIYWDFEFSNVSGGGLNVGAVEFRTDITSRKI